jgi:hypothetical protein
LRFGRLFHLGLNTNPCLFKCDGLLAVAVYDVVKRLTVVGVDCDFVARG